MNLISNIKASLLDGQHGHPTGIIGRILGEQMVRQHVPETSWTILLLNLKPADQTLELGFGAGKAIELVATQTITGHIFGIDISHEMLRSASRRNVQAIKAGRVTLQQGDVANLPYADNQFTKIFSIQSFYFWPDSQRTLAEIFRVLKPGGTLIITLSTGTTDTKATGLEQYQFTLEEQVVPTMQRLGFTRAYIEQGPASRQFKTTAVIGIK